MNYALVAVFMVCALVMSSVGPIDSVSADGIAPRMQLHDLDGRVQFAWSGARATPISDLLTLNGWTIHERTDNPLPIYPIMLAVRGDESPLHIEAITQNVRPDAKEFLETVAVGDDKPMAAAAATQPDKAENRVTIPHAPLTIIREGVARGQRYRVIHFSPLYLNHGMPTWVQSLRATLPGELDVQQPAGLSTRLRTTADDEPNAAARHDAVKLIVRQSGMQQVRLTELGAAGIGPDFDPAQIALSRGGVAIPLEHLGDSIRFYAPPPGDRWNTSDVYWLTLADEGGMSMDMRTTEPAGSDASPVAVERGTWSDNTVYDSWVPGPDSDHWFARELRTITSPDPVAGTVDVPIETRLPLSAGAATLTIYGGSRTYRERQLAVALGGQWNEMLLNPEQTTVAVTYDQSSHDIRITLHPRQQSDSFLLDSVTWEVPVRLEFRQRGATFWTLPGVTSYRLSTPPVDAQLYDITNPAQPVRLAGSATAFRDTPATTPRHYLVTGLGTLHQPEVQSYQAFDLASPLNADVIYIAPQPFQAELTPLVELRRSQGHAVTVVDVADIYAWWSYGHVAPNAIRRFLRHAAATWQRVPVAVVLVGDGTSDPLDYTGRHNANHIPPYLARVDHVAGETACETCYVQLDGDDPLDDVLPDMQIGRFPVKTVAELQQLVTKLVAYEQASAGGTWRSRLAYIADNADRAGDFAALADASAAQQPAELELERVYYDPQPATDQPWREPDPVRARQRTLAALNNGAAVVSYYGHGLQWQWAATGPPLTADQPTDQQYLLGLYDVDALTNGPQLPVVLSMTCLTGAFQQPAYAGTTIDERLLLHRSGGAVAVWSSTGFGVAVGHQALQRGFFRQLWQGTPGGKPLGQLMDAGYREYFAAIVCCEDGLRTYALLGDPLTPLRIESVEEHVFLPVALRAR